MIDQEVTARPRQMGIGASVRLWAALACYAVALPFEIVMVWSALQVIFADTGHAMNAVALRQVVAVELARTHPIPSIIFTVVSLAAAFVGAALHQSYRRAVSKITPA